MGLNQLAQSLKAEANRLGFEFAAICPAVSPNGFDNFCAWLDQGFAGEMKYLPNRRDAYSHPQNVMDGVRSLLMLGMGYQGMPGRTQRLGAGRVASYAASDCDYHDVIWDATDQLAKFVHEQRPDANCRGVVDTTPLLEREFAQLAGLGWQGKNTMLIRKQSGSYFFLAALLLDIELEYDQPVVTNHCGSCTRCLDACPTDAFVEPGVMDARRCISYLTIELRKPIPLEFRNAMGDWVFGCDVCQDVCPWNRFSCEPLVKDFQVDEQDSFLDLKELLLLDDEAFRQRYRATPLWRAKRRGVLRNAAIVMGNQRLEEHLPTLVQALDDVEPLVRGAVAWALGKYCSEDAGSALRRRLSIEVEAEVRIEIERSLIDFSAF